MIIEKKQNKMNNSVMRAWYYPSARAGMHEAVEQMRQKGFIDTVLLPGYIGWSPKEGSGIFDSVSSVAGINIRYYRMDENLEIDAEDLYSKLGGHPLVLLVNYFGFRDKAFAAIIEKLKSCNAWVMEDNAHGFYTWHEGRNYPSDIVVFSLHKMFPFDGGGSIIVQDEMLLDALDFSGSREPMPGQNPYSFRIHDISEKRRGNFLVLAEKLKPLESKGILKSLRPRDELDECVPQTYPVLLNRGNRDRVYQMMNDAGYGVVSLYHTLISSLKDGEFEPSRFISKHIMNLPVHQDVDASAYVGMVDCLEHCCMESEVG